MPSDNQIKIKPTEPVFGEARGGVYLISNNRQIFFKAEAWDDLRALMMEFEIINRTRSVQNYVEPEKPEPRVVSFVQPVQKKKANLDDLI